jgi:hypothetical protein
MEQREFSIRNEAMMASSEADYRRLLDHLRGTETTWGCFRCMTDGFEQDQIPGKRSPKNLARMKAKGETATLICLNFPILRRVILNPAFGIRSNQQSRAAKVGLEIMEETINQWNPQEVGPKGKPVRIERLIEENLTQKLPPIFKIDAS